MLRSALAVFAGGIVGTALRIGLDATVPHADDAFPMSTLIINVVGSFVLALLVARVWPVASEWVRAGLGPGLLGSFTTFSAVVVSIVSLVEARELPVALVYLALTLFLGFAAAALGLSLGRPLPIEADE